MRDSLDESGFRFTSRWPVRGSTREATERVCDQLAATVFKTPSRWRGNAAGVTVAQVIRMWLSRGGQMVQPHERIRVLIGQCDGC